MGSAELEEVMMNPVERQQLFDTAERILLARIQHSGPPVNMKHAAMECARMARHLIWEVRQL